MRNNSLSVVIPVYNAGLELNLCLEAILNQSLPAQEIILIDDGSSTPVDVRQFPNIQIIRHENNLGPSQARNTGMKASSSEFILFVDSDIIIPHDAISRVSRILRDSVDPKIGITTARHSISNKDHVGLVTCYKEVYMNYVFSKQKENVDFLYGGFCAFKRPSDILWPQGLRFAEDTFMGQLLFESGYTIKLLNDLEIKHIKNYDVLSFLKHSYLIAFHFNQSLLAKKAVSLHHSHATFHQLISIVLTFLILFTLMLTHMSLLSLFLALWMIHNFQFILFLRTHFSKVELVMVFLLTLVDQLTKGTGIFLGFIFFGSRHQLKKRKLIHSPAE
jgi:glycosyltransferase involved in cell wall biosynthesis